MSKVRVRIHFTKTDDLRWISHRDLARVWERLLRRAGLQLAFSEGFHPKPKISFPSALALGIVALDEVVEMDLIGPVDLDQARVAISKETPPGMQLLDMQALAPGAAKALVIAATYGVELSENEAAVARQSLEQLQAAGEVAVLREGKQFQAAFGDPWFRINLTRNALEFTLPNTAQGSLRPSELLEALGLSQLLANGAVLTRTAVHLATPQGSSPADCQPVGHRDAKETATDHHEI